MSDKRYTIIFDGPNANFRDNQGGCLWCGMYVPGVPPYICLRTPLGEKHCGYFCYQCRDEAKAREGRRNIWERGL